MPKLVLYKKDSCPFCQKVMGFMKANNIDIEMKDIIQDSANKDYLVEHGGKNQVPCLFIDDEPMYESDDIIDYLRQNCLEGEEVEAEAPAGPQQCPFD